MGKKLKKRNIAFEATASTVADALQDAQSAMFLATQKRWSRYSWRLVQKAYDQITNAQKLLKSELRWHASQKRRKGNAK